MSKSTKITFKGQKIFIGLDVHLKNWCVTVCSQNAILKTFNMPPSPEGLHSYLTRNYPDGEYYSVYEAGFCGLVGNVAISLHHPRSSNQSMLKLNISLIIWLLAFALLIIFFMPRSFLFSSNLERRISYNFNMI